MSKTIAINAGSSSLKWTLYQMPQEDVLASGSIERIGLNNSVFKIKKGIHSGFTEVIQISTHEEAVQKLLKELKDKKILLSFDEVTGVAHRVVAGGEEFKESVIVDDSVIQKIEEMSELAPLHNPANAVGLKAFYKLLPNAINVAVFDTSFHHTLKPVHFLYSLPFDYYETYGARKYGAHGISHEYVAEYAARILKKPLQELKLITCHLGNGSSLAAILNGKSVDTSMGFTPLAGVTMGTRSGDVDPSLLPYLMRKLGITEVEEMIHILNTESGLKGISGISSDMRDIEREMKNNPRAQLAFDIFVDRIKQYMGAYIATLNGVDAIVFTAGIGENDSLLRERIATELSNLGLLIDSEKNKTAKGPTIISKKESPVTLLMIPTDEQLMIARQVEKFK